MPGACCFITIEYAVDADTLRVLLTRIEAGGDLAMAVEESRKPGDCNVCIRGEVDDLGRLLLDDRRADDAAQVEGIEAGADDYLVKPFAFAELPAAAWNAGIVGVLIAIGYQRTRDRNPSMVTEIAQMITFLLESGADKTIRDANGDSPQSWASWHWRPSSP